MYVDSTPSQPIKFLFSEETVKYLRQLWLDAVECNLQNSYDTADASERQMEITLKYIDSDPDDRSLRLIAFEAMKVDFWRD